MPRETYKISPNSTRGSFYTPSSGDGTTSGDFDIRSFHDTVLGNGSLPIAELEELVTEWIDERRG